MFAGSHGPSPCLAIFAASPHDITLSAPAYAHDIIMDLWVDISNLINAKIEASL
jgi:hypothetical protein